MYVCVKCGNYKSFTVSVPERVTNSLVKVTGREYETQKFEKESLWENVDGLMQDIEETMVCDECESMGIVDVLSEYLDIELQNELHESLKTGQLNKPLMEIMRKEASKVGDEIEEKDLG